MKNTTTSRQQTYAHCNALSRTHVHLVIAGGGQRLMCFDCGASSSFESCIEGTPEKYML